MGNCESNVRDRHCKAEKNRMWLQFLATPDDGYMAVVFIRRPRGVLTQEEGRPADVSPMTENQVSQHLSHASRHAISLHRSI